MGMLRSSIVGLLHPSPDSASSAIERPIHIVATATIQSPARSPIAE
jgi:hypothetical protein